jgi:titin
MNVSWNVPEDDGGSPITSYVVEVKDFDRKSWTELATVPASQLSYIATKLTIGTRYSYRISAENKYGRGEPAEIPTPVEAKYPFNVPDAPQNCQARDVTPTSCTVTFEVPKSDGGSPITGYIIERRQMSGRWVRMNREPIQQLSYKCNDLTEGIEYEFRAIAENKAGPSEPSEPCKPFIAKNPFDRPSPPLNVQPGNVTSSKIELTWSPPLSDGGSPITGYKIERRNPKTMKWMPIDGLGRITQCRATINDVQENKEYEFRVVATNAAGDSDPSASTPLIVAKTKIVGEKPMLLEPMKDQRVLVGATAHFEAKLTAKPPPDIKWFLNERPLNSRDDNFVSTYDNQSLELTISNVQLKDEGVYKVNVKNPLGELDADAKLTVLKKPVIKYDARFDKTYDVIAQQNLNIACEVTGAPKPEVKW